MRGAPRTVVFCTISKLARLVTITKPVLGSVPALSRAPMSLSRALCRPTSSRTSCTAPSSPAQAAACTAPAAALSDWCEASVSSARRIEEPEIETVSSTGWSCFSTIDTLSAPQMPQPVRPVSRRVRPAITSSQAGLTRAWISMPWL